MFHVVVKCGETPTKQILTAFICYKSNYPASTPRAARERQSYRSNIGIRLWADVSFVRRLNIGPRAANLSGQHRHLPAGRCSFSIGPTSVRGRQTYRANIGIRLRADVVFLHRANIGIHLRADVSFVRWLNIRPRAAHKRLPIGSRLQTDD